MTWYDRIIIGSVLIGAVGIIWTKLIHPAMRIVRAVEEFYPVIAVVTQMAAEFKPTHGVSLKEAIVELQESYKEIDKDLKDFKSNIDTRFADLSNSILLHSVTTIEAILNKDEDDLESSKKYLNYPPRSQRGSPEQEPEE